MQRLTLLTTIILISVTACAPATALPTELPTATTTVKTTPVPANIPTPTLEPWMQSLPENVTSIEIEEDKIFGLDSQGNRIMKYSLDAGKWEEVMLTVGPLTVEIVKSGQEWNGMTFEAQEDGTYTLKTPEGMAVPDLEINADGSLVVRIDGERKTFAYQSVRVIDGMLWVGWRYWDKETSAWSAAQSVTAEQVRGMGDVEGLYPSLAIVRGSTLEAKLIKTWTEEGANPLSAEQAVAELAGIKVKGQDYTQKVVRVQVRNYSSVFNDQFGSKSVVALNQVMDGGSVVEDGSMDAHARKIQIGLEGGWRRLDIIDSETGSVEEYWQVPVVAEDVGGKVRVSRGLLSVDAVNELMQYMVRQPNERGEAHRGYLDLWLMNAEKIPERPSEDIKVGRQGILISSQINGDTDLMRNKISEQGTASQKIGSLPADYEKLVFSVMLQYWVYRGWPSNIQW